MRTYMKVYFSSNGKSPREVLSKMEALGWKPVIGDYDFVWEGGLSDSLGDMFLEHLDKVHEALSDCDVRYCFISKR